MSFEKKKCAVKISKYERKDRDAVNYWLQVFKELEDKANVPYVERAEEVIQCIPYSLYERIAPLLGLDTKLADPKVHKKHEARYSTVGKPAQKEEAQPEFDDYEDLFFLEQTDNEDRLGILEDDDDDDVGCDLDILVRPPITRSALKKPPEFVSPYYSFVKRKGKRAVNWESRYMPKHVLEDWEKTLHQRATEKTESIVREFCEWLRGLGGQESALTETALNELFEIGRVDDAAQALMIRVRELYTVTPEVAQAAGLPERATRPTLHRQVMRDALESMRPARHFAFGTALPKDMIRHRVQADTDKWLTCRHVPRGLASMRLVWEGITAIRSTRAYCKWLREHPEIEPPEYLVRVGMMDADYGVSRGQPRVSMIPDWDEPPPPPQEQEATLEDAQVEDTPAPDSAPGADTAEGSEAAGALDERLE